MLSSKRLLLYGVDAAFEASRMMVGSISAVYLMSKGATLVDLAGVKAVQGVVLMTADLPAGILADRYGWKKSLVLATMAGSLGFVIYYFGHSALAFLIAEIFAALAICCWSGAYEAFALDQLRQGSEESDAVEQFFHMNHSVTTGAVVLAGLLSYGIGIWSLDGVYIAATLIMAALAALLVSLPLSSDTMNNAAERIHWADIARALHSDLLMRAVLPLAACMIILQFFMQPILHYWQPLFTEVKPAVSSDHMGLVFSSYCVVQSLSSYLMARALRAGYRPRGIFLWTMVSAAAACYILMGHSSQLVIVLVAFALAQATFGVARSRFSAAIAQRVSVRSRASVMSALNVLSRCGMLSSLATLAALFAHDTGTNGRAFVAPMFSLYGMGLAFAAASVLLWMILKNFIPSNGGGLKF